MHSWVYTTQTSGACSYEVVSHQPCRVRRSVSRDQSTPERRCRLQTQQPHQSLNRNVIVNARRGKGDSKRDRINGSQKPPAGTAAGSPTDSAGLLQALVQLASRSTIMLGSHQAYVSRLSWILPVDVAFMVEQAYSVKACSSPQLTGWYRLAVTPLDLYKYDALHLFNCMMH